jgi:hypothetical protein
LFAERHAFNRASAGMAAKPVIAVSSIFNKYLFILSYFHLPKVQAMSEL